MRDFSKRELDRLAELDRRLGILKLSLRRLDHLELINERLIHNRFSIQILLSSIVLARFITRSSRAKPCTVVTNDVPSSASFLLCLFLNKKDRQTIPGDLHEEFHADILPKFGPRRARLWYWSQTLTAIATRTPLVKWVFVGGGILKVYDWITRRISG